MRILVDMDCTVVDFQRGACRAHGIDYDTFVAAHLPGEYGTHLNFERVTGKPMTQAEFWTPIHRDHYFWNGLEPLPWCRELFELVTATTDDWAIVTSPSRCGNVYRGKKVWLETYLGKEAGEPHRFVPTSAKYLLASPGTILIDDSDDNCHQFVTCPRRGKPTGARAVLFPALHNPLHQWAGGREMDHVRRALPEAIAAVS